MASGQDAAPGHKGLAVTAEMTRPLAGSPLGTGTHRPTDLLTGGAVAVLGPLQSRLAPAGTGCGRLWQVHLPNRQ